MDSYAVEAACAPYMATICAMADHLFGDHGGPAGACLVVFAPSDLPAAATGATPAETEPDGACVRIGRWREVARYLPAHVRRDGATYARRRSLPVVWLGSGTDVGVMGLRPSAAS